MLINDPVVDRINGVHFFVVVIVLHNKTLSIFDVTLFRLNIVLARFNTEKVHTIIIVVVIINTNHT